MQQITYQEYLPSMNIFSDTGEYDPTVDPSISNAFATLAFRMGHSQIGPLTLRLEEIEPRYLKEVLRWKMVSGILILS